MRFNWRRLNIRNRILMAYMSILLLGFAALTIISGTQISTAARTDYEREFLSTTRLITQGIRPYVTPDNMTDAPSLELLDAITLYEDETDIKIEFVAAGAALWSIDIVMPEDVDDNFVEIAPARGIMEIADETGELQLVTVTVLFDPIRINPDDFPTEPPIPPVLVFSVPYANLQTIILQRWAGLAVIGILVGVFALIAGRWVAATITRPLDHLRDTAVRLAQGNFSHRVKDVTQDEIGEVAQAFNAMAQQVENMLEEQRTFASNTSHELRTPLTTIRLRSEALRYEALDEATAQAYIIDIDNEVSRLSVLIEDLTLLSRLDANRAELGQSEIDMQRFGESLVTQLQMLSAKKQITLTVSAEANIPPVIAGLNHLTIIFRNILENAIKYTLDGGQITWHIAPNKDNNAVVSTIQDNGQGIAPQHLTRIFERFYRVDQSRSRQVAGTGLGLPLVKSIVEAYGGTIAISSDGLGKGTLVTITIPYRMPTAT